MANIVNLTLHQASSRTEVRRDGRPVAFLEHTSSLWTAIDALTGAAIPLYGWATSRAIAVDLLASTIAYRT